VTLEDLRIADVTWENESPETQLDTSILSFMTTPDIANDSSDEDEGVRNSLNLSPINVADYFSAGAFSDIVKEQ
jgi:hypothetical protein